MLPHWVILLVSFGYLGLLFAVAYYGDKRADAGRSIISNPYIYTFSIAVYCTGWTFYGSVGRAAATGVGFLPIYLGPTLAALLWWLLLRKIIHLSKVFNITSIADFIASRFGKSMKIGGLVTIIAVVGIMPYISLQLKAISLSFNTLFHFHGIPQESGFFLGEDTALYVALILAVFAILFGTRHIDVTERHEGMVAAIAFESLVKFLAFTAVGLFVTFSIYRGPGDLYTEAMQVPELARLMEMDALPGGYAAWFSLTFISMTAIMFLPRQFQVLVVENVNEDHVRTATWLFPLYLFAINLFVIPIAFAGVMQFAGASVDPDTMVLALPLMHGHNLLALFVFLGGLSAATGMVIVESIALSTMLSNDLLVPIMLRLKLLRTEGMGGVLLTIRRGCILGVLLLGYLYFRLIGESYALVTIGLVSFAAAAQFAPAILLGLYWKGASRSGALAGLAAGFVVWAYTLLLPSFAKSGWLPMSIVDPGPFGISALGPYHLLNLTMFDPITHSVFWSMLFNVGFLVAVSLYDRPTGLDQLQAAMFVQGSRASDTGDTRFWHGTTRVEDLKGLVARLLGVDRAERAFQSYARQHGLKFNSDTVADAMLLEFTERELAKTVGAASARVMMSSIIEGEALSIEGLMRIMDETSQVIEYSRQLEQKSRELEVATQELQRTNERLKELDVLKDDFVNTISHELRTPLTSIRALSEILHDEINMDPDDRQRFLGIMVKETERLTRLVNQVLDFSKIESGAVRGIQEDLELTEVVQEALATTIQLARDRNVVITNQLPSGSVRVTGDRDRLVQVVVNLLSNAIKYCDDQAGKVHLRLVLEPEEVRVEVRDNGPGIRPEERERIFEKFHQLSDTVKGKPHGTGLGLAICKAIVQNHGGRIWVEDNFGGGSIFIVTLPV